MKAHQDVRSDDFVLFVYWDCTVFHIIREIQFTATLQKIQVGIQDCLQLFHIYLCTTGRDFWIEKLYAQNQNCSGLHRPFRVNFKSQANGTWSHDYPCQMPITKLMLCMNIDLKTSQIALPILKFGKEVASRASTADADSFLSNPKKEQF